MDGVKPDIELDEYYESLLWQQRRTKSVKPCSLADWSNLSSNRKNWRNNQTANGYNKNSLDDLLALVTALLANPSIFFIEEPTYELGTSSAEKIGANLLAFETGLTVTVTLHHPSTHFDGLVDMLHLHRGCIVCIRWKSFRRCRVLELGMSPEYMSRVNYFML
ncbi:hypothetical protein PC114_g21885 [Phytophthora cactorum]|uniref:P-loop containing nucleoside triphosphate hydrolase n=1 Tax=Phytophthora cactorum TaxID=29920 RepID=A0A8T1C3N1_9STRA|nr:hypothetical protein PC114_g21885 [Phytophthora cactorum]KAG2915859.1 hypothetical protein PC117_g17889 [Phytophthora cactorum]